MYDGRAQSKQNARWSGKKMYDGRARVKQKMQAGRAKQSAVVEQGGEKNVRWTSKKMQDGLAKRSMGRFSF